MFWLCKLGARKYLLALITGILLFSACMNHYAEENAPGTVVSATNISGSFWENRAYNDPCVIKNGDLYYMYLSKNTDEIYTDGRKQPVSTFLATSNDKLNWVIDTTEKIKPGNSGDWDYNKAETPSVIQFNGIYHMYYFGGSQYSNPVSYKIGHATSSNGIDWTKDASNPIITPSSLTDVSLVLHVAEPGAVVYQGKVYLYFAVTKQRIDKPSPESQMEIYLGISEDGYTINSFQEVLSQTGTYPAEKGYVGYSTPSALVNNGKIHLFYDVFYQTNNNINKYEQVLIQCAESNDGINFIEDVNPVISRDQQNWTKREIRGGSEIIENGIIHMWFSGDDYAIKNNVWSGKMTIGYAHWKME